MKSKMLLVIDMQNDFVTGTLGSKEAEGIVPSVTAKIKEFQSEGYPVFFTRDTHDINYMNTQEGRMLPVAHCEEGSEGWQIVDALNANINEDIFDKPAFGSIELPAWIESKLGQIPDEIEICGICTDICVINNAMILKAAFPETKITVIQECCAGVTPESHEIALLAMAGCQIIIN